ncbi:MAG: nucleotidyltransferase domain-containing protein [Patescibacteria group bacterium]|jgi:predicted nucleotidyltransferase
MNEKLFAEQGKVLEYRVGSHLYGTNTPTSDEDYSGVFVAPEEYYLGLNSVEEVDLSVVSKREDGKNNPDAVDRKLYEFRKFVRLSLENNPNVVEQLFVNEPNLLFANDFGRELLSHRHMFLHRGLKHKFLGYGFSQKHKMIIRTDKFYELKNALDWMKEFNKPELYMVELKDKQLPFMMFKQKHVTIGDLDFELTRQMRWVQKKVEERLSKVGNRKELYLSKGYDTKFASHFLRLLMEGMELLETGDLQFPLRDRELVLEVKEGKWNLNEVLKLGDEVEKWVEKLSEKSPLPSRPRFDEVNRLVVGMLKRHFHYEV